MKGREGGREGGEGREGGREGGTGGGGEGEASAFGFLPSEGPMGCQLPANVNRRVTAVVQKIIDPPGVLDVSGG